VYVYTRVRYTIKLSRTRLQNHAIGASLMSVSVTVSVSVPWNSSLSRRGSSCVFGWRRTKLRMNKRAAQNIVHRSSYTTGRLSAWEAEQVEDVGDGVRVGDVECMPALTGYGHRRLFTALGCMERVLFCHTVPFNLCL